MGVDMCLAGLRLCRGIHGQRSHHATIFVNHHVAVEEKLANNVLVEERNDNHNLARDVVGFPRDNHGVLVPGKWLVFSVDGDDLKVQLVNVENLSGCHRNIRRGIGKGNTQKRVGERVVVLSMEKTWLVLRQMSDAVMYVSMRVRGYCYCT